MKLERSNLFLVAAVTYVAASSAHAAIETWNSTTGNWSSANWSGISTSFTNGDDAVFSSGTANNAITLDSNFTAGNIFSNGANTPGTMTITGSGNSILTLGTGTAGSGNISDVAGTGTGYAGNLTYNLAGAGGIALAAGSGTTATPTIWNIASTKTFTIGNTSNGQTFDLNGNTLNLSGAGTVLLNAGGLTLKSTGGTGVINVNAGILKILGGGSRNIAVDNTVAINVATGATMQVGYNSGGGSTFAQALTLNGGTLERLDAGAQTFAFGGTIALGTGGGTIKNSGGAGWNIGSVISGSNLTTSNNTITLTGTNTYTGTTTITGGTLEIGGAGSLGSGNYVGTISNAGTLLVSTSVNQTLSGAISGAGVLTKSGTGTLTLSGTHNYTGATSVNAGTLNLTGSLTSAVTVNSGGALAGTGSTTGNITFNAGSAVFAGDTGAQGVNVTGNAAANIYVSSAPTGAPATVAVVRHTGTFTGTFNTANYRAGSISDAAGTVSLTYTGEAKTWSPTTGGTWDLNTSTPWTGGSDAKFYWGDSVAFGGSATQTVTLTGNLAPSSITVNNTGGTYTFSTSTTGSIVGGGSLSKSGAGSLTLSTANTYSGGTTVNLGTLTVANATALGSGAVQVNGGTNHTNLTVNGGLNVSNALTLTRGTGGRAYLNLGSGSTGSTWSGDITLDNTTTSNYAAIWAFGSTTGTASIVSGNIAASVLGTANTTNPTIFFRGSAFGKVTGSVSLANGYIQTAEPSNWEFSNASNSWATLDIAHSNAVVAVGAANTLASSGVVRSSVGGTLRLNNQAATTAYSQTIAGLSGDVKVGLATGAATLTVNTTADQSSTGVISNAISLVKSGNAKQTLSGTNTYTGITSINAGTLIINGDQTAATGNVSVTGILAGSGGIVGGITTVNSGGHLAVGNGTAGSVGTQTFTKDLTLSTGSIFDWDLTTAAETGNGFDKVIGASGKTFDATGATFRVITNLDFTSDTFWDTAKTWNTIFSGFGTLTGWAENTPVAVYGTNGAMRDVSVEGSFTVTGGTLNWNFSAVPEPTSALAGLLLGAGLLRRRRKN